LNIQYWLWHVAHY